MESLPPLAPPALAPAAEIDQYSDNVGDYRTSSLIVAGLSSTGVNEFENGPCFHLHWSLLSSSQMFIGLIYCLLFVDIELARRGHRRCYRRRGNSRCDGVRSQGLLAADA